jgi:hypothetical protein
MSAIDLQIQLRELVAERALVVSDGSESLVELSDLDDEIRFTREAYIAAAVTEIATLRADLSGPQWG